jgi:predicted amidohydrolase YtcJ
MVLPGFQDGHVHLLAGGVELAECTLFTLQSAAAIADSIRACAAARPKSPWVRGAGWELTVFPDANPSRALLDRIVGDFEPFWANGDEYLTRLAEPALGRSRSRWLYPIGSLVSAGAVVSGGSDWSVSSLAPLDGIQVAITRREPSAGGPAAPWLPEEVVDLPAAIAMYTINAAYQNHQERETGSIEVGKLADLVILEQNLFDVAPREIHAVRVMQTMLEGRTVFERGR